ncbi:siderophore-interacting protein [Streptomyces sp. NPDC093085]|uniref:siderophore-interacting protein n=1 Tax=Streptomyces sp. NPDC093085 TaxID=3155068 RepID=UPI003418DD66
MTNVALSPAAATRPPVSPSSSPSSPSPAPAPASAAPAAAAPAPAAPAASPFEFFPVEVVRAERITPSMARIVLGGPALARMVSAGRDQRIKVFLPHPGQREPVLPEARPGGGAGDWYGDWRALDPAVRGIMRTYTVRELRHAPDELVIDFALHGADGSASGPASRWAASAAPGDRISVLGPVVEENAGYDFRPPEGTEWILLTADESALPAVASILETLPAGTPARIWIEVHDAADRQELRTAADADITWLVHGTSPATPDAIRAAALPEGTPYAWVAGEASTVKAVRRHLVGERGFDRRAVKFSGYWRQGASEDNLMQAAEEEA